MQLTSATEGANATSARAAMPPQWSEPTRAFVAAAADASSRWILEIPDVVRAVTAATALLPEPAQATLVGAALVARRTPTDCVKAIRTAMDAVPGVWGVREQVRIAASAVVGTRPLGDIRAAIDNARSATPLVMPDTDKATVAGMILRSSAALADVPAILQRAQMSGGGLAAINDALWPIAEPPLYS